jgi:hypothetical protein
MKKILMIGAAVASALAVPAGAQTVTGTINITGQVTSKCAVVGGASTSTFTDNVNLGELAQANGTLEASGTLAARFLSTNSGAVPAFRVVCNSATPAVAVDATELTTTGTVGAGYTNRIDYVAHVTVAKATGGSTTVDNATTAGATAATPVGSAISGAPGNNVTVTADNFTTPGGAATLLVAGTYNGQIAVTITPS